MFRKLAIAFLATGLLAAPALAATESVSKTTTVTTQGEKPVMKPMAKPHAMMKRHRIHHYVVRHYKARHHLESQRITPKAPQAPARG
jgi:hypothetical protein